MEIREDMITYKNKKEKKPKIKITRTLKQGANESKLEIESHTGTHADAYFHMLANGKTIENMPLNKFIGDCVVLDFTKVKDKKISLGNFKNKKIKKDEIILLKTRNKSLKKFDFNFTYVDKSGAKFLANKKIKLVGIDNSGIERAQPNHETHEILFKKNIPIVEGLDLTKIKPGRYFFIGLPLKIKGADGSPIRAVLIKN